MFKFYLFIFCIKDHVNFFACYLLRLRFCCFNCFAANCFFAFLFSSSVPSIFSVSSVYVCVFYLMNLHASGVHTSIQTCAQKYTSVDVHVCVFLQEEMQEEDNSPKNDAGTRGVCDADGPPHDCLLFFTYISRYPGVSSHLSLHPSLSLSGLERVQVPVEEDQMVEEKHGVCVAEVQGGGPGWRQELACSLCKQLFSSLLQLRQHEYSHTLSLMALSLDCLDHHRP